MEKDDSKFLCWVEKTMRNKEEKHAIAFVCRVLLGFYLLFANAKMSGYILVNDIQLAALKAKKVRLMKRVEKLKAQNAVLMAQKAKEEETEEMRGKENMENKTENHDDEYQKNEADAMQSRHEALKTLFNVVHNLYLGFTIFTIGCKIFAPVFGYANGVNVIMLKIAYAIFAGLVLLLPEGLRGEFDYKRQYVEGLIVGFLVLTAELGVIIFCMH